MMIFPGTDGFFQILPLITALKSSMHICRNTLGIYLREGIIKAITEYPMNISNPLITEVLLMNIINLKKKIYNFRIIYCYGGIIALYNNLWMYFNIFY